MNRSLNDRPPPLVRLPEDAIRVTDADEEVFLLYTRLSSIPPADNDANTFRGLGYLDSRSDTLTVDITVTRPRVQSDVPNKKKTSKAKMKDGRSTSLSFLLAQDKTALRSRKGDTGSVLWRASIDLVEYMLQELVFPSSDTLFDPAELARTRVIELGSGTGLVGIALSPYVQDYTLTDIPELLPLIKKTVALNYKDWSDSNRQTASSSFLPSASSRRSSRVGIATPSGAGKQSSQNIHVEELDWVHLASLPLNTPARSKYLSISPFPFIYPNERVSNPNHPLSTLILAVDCIYNPALLSPLVETLNECAKVSRSMEIGVIPTALVVVELRADDVVREFLELWLASEDWEVYSLPAPLGVRYGIWIGWSLP